MNDIFYVYAILDPRKSGNYKYGNFVFSFEPFYIGKGKGDRCRKHFTKKVLAESNLPVHNKIKKIMRENFMPVVIKLKTELSETAALELERLLISIMGKRHYNTGILENLIDGGTGFSGYHYKFTEEHKQKISNALKGKKKSEEHILNISKSHKGIPNNWKGRKHTKESRLNMSKARKGKSWNAIHGEENSNIRKTKSSERSKGKNNPFFGKKHTDEVKKFISEQNKKLIGEHARNAKTWIFHSPDGDKYIIKGSFGRFCNEHGLSISSMKKVAKGKQKTYKNWRCYEENKT